MSDLELSRLKKERQRAEQKDQLKEVALLCNLIGEHLSKQGEYEDAIREHERELALSEALDDTIGVAVANRKIGECYCESGRYDDAIQYQKRHLELAQSCNSDVEEQRAHATIGRTYLYQAESVKDADLTRISLKNAENAFTKSLEVCEKLRAKIDVKDYMEMRARLLLNIGLVYDNRGDVKKCAQFIGQAISIAEKHSLHEDLYRCQFSLAAIYQQNDRASQALRLLEVALQCAQKMKDKASQSEALAQKGQILIQLKDFHAAGRCLKKAYKLGTPREADKHRIYKMLKAAILMIKVDEELQSLSDGDYLEQYNLYEKLGDAAAGVGNFKQALDYYHNMLRCAKTLNKPVKDLIPIFVSLAQTYMDDKQYGKAEEYYQKELTCRKGDHEQECRTWLNIAEAQELNGESYDHIARSYVEAWEGARQAKHRRLQMHVLKSLAAVQQAFALKEELLMTNGRLDKLKQKFGISSDDEASDAEDSQGVEDEEEELDLADISESETSDNEEYDRGAERSEPGQPRRLKRFRITRNEKGETPLHRACIDGSMKRVQRLIEQGHPVNPRDHCGWLPLHEACNHGHIDIVEHLINKGAWINDRGGAGCGDITPLHDTCSCGHWDIIRLLVKRGANVHAKDKEGNTPADSLREWRSRAGEMTAQEEMDYRAVLALLCGTMTGNNPHLHDMRTLSSATEPDHLPTIRFETRRNKQATKQLAESPLVYTDEEDSEPNTGSQLPPRTSLSDFDEPGVAPAAYKEAILSMGSAATRAHLKPSQQPQSQRRQALRNQTAAFLSEEDPGDDWLVEDIQVRPSKRKNADIDSLFSTTGSRENKKPRRSKERCEQEPAIVEENISETEEDLVELLHSDSDDASEDIQQRSQNNRDNSNLNRLTLNKTKQKRMIQLSMANYGIDNLTDNFQNGDHSNNNLVEEVSSVSEANGTVSSATPRPLPASSVKIKVRIKDRLVCIPVCTITEPQTIGKLAEAAAERHRNLFNLKPLLTLSTQDGAYLADNDMIEFLLTDGEEVVGNVRGWDLPPLPDRYVEACASLKTVAYRNVKTILGSSASSGSLHLNNLALQFKFILPVLRALQCEATLKELYLKGNKIGDEGFKNVGSILPSLSSLQVLDVSANRITFVGVKMFCEELASTSNTAGQMGHEALQKVDLSYNNLGDSSTQHVTSLVGLLPALCDLSLASCDFTLKFFQQHRMILAEKLQGSRLQQLDISRNRLGPTGVELMLKCLPVRHLQVINLTGVMTSPTTTNHITRYLQAYVSQVDCALRHIDVSSCHLTSDQMVDISKIITNSKALQTLKISGNPKLCNEDFIDIIQASAKDDTSRLQKIECISCSISSPLNTEMIDVISEKLGHEYPLDWLEFTCCGLSTVDQDSLKMIWTNRWTDQAQWIFDKDTVKLCVMD